MSKSISVSNISVSNTAQDYSIVPVPSYFYTTTTRTNVLFPSIGNNSTPQITYSGGYNLVGWDVYFPEIRFGFTLQFKRSKSKLSMSWSEKDVEKPEDKLKRIL